MLYYTVHNRVIRAVQKYFIFNHSKKTRFRHEKSSQIEKIYKGRGKLGAIAV